MTRRKRKQSAAKASPIIPQIGTRQSDIVLDSEVENPHYARQHDGEAWNPRLITVAVNRRESTFVSLKARKTLTDESQIKAATMFLRFYEDMGGSGVKAIDYGNEPVDGGGTRDPISDKIVNAGLRLKEAREHIGVRPYFYVQKVIGEGYTLAQLMPSQRGREMAGQYLRDALDELAALWGINRPSSFKRKSA
jgi:hypothetical protein